ncbi:MAG TPA: beta-propeller fold lactonase family protein, partial [Spirochaetia bacterium]
RQEGPHAHSLLPAPRAPGAPLFAVGCDLGLDTVSVFRLDEADGRLLPHADIGVSPGAGPRSVAFDAAGRHAYVMTEMASTIVVLDWDPVAGRLAPKQEIAVLESGSPGPRHGTEILLSPDGAHAYATNRGEDCIVIFRVDAGSGTLALVGRVALPGRTPRHSVFTPAGDMLLVACQDSDEILSFRHQPGRGGLDLVARSALPAPACLVLADRR